VSMRMDRAEAGAVHSPVVEDPRCSPDDVCITCGDVAVELTVLRVDEDRLLALCADETNRRETVETALVGSVAAGDTLLVHAGTAIAHLGGPA
jgi:hydrogenase maturation factor